MDSLSQKVCSQRPAMNLILMLEDDLERIQRFTAIVKRNHPFASLNVSRTAFEFKAAYGALHLPPDIICLDHDLFADLPDDPDPGDGREIANFLATRLTRCPVLIHSSNSVAADAMLYDLRDAGWTVDRIAPIGHDWIENYWYPNVCDMIERGNDLANQIEIG